MGGTQLYDGGVTAAMLEVQALPKQKDLDRRPWVHRRVEGAYVGQVNRRAALDRFTRQLLQTATIGSCDKQLH